MSHYYYYYYYYYYFSCHSPFLPGTSSREPAVIPTAQASDSDCSTFRVIWDVPSIAVFCSESIQYFLSMASKCFFIPFVTIPVAPIIICVITHFMFRIH